MAMLGGRSGPSGLPAMSIPSTSRLRSLSQIAAATSTMPDASHRRRGSPRPRNERRAGTRRPPGGVRRGSRVTAAGADLVSATPARRPIPICVQLARALDSAPDVELCFFTLAHRADRHLRHGAPIHWPESWLVGPHSPATDRAPAADRLLPYAGGSGRTPGSAPGTTSSGRPDCGASTTRAARSRGSGSRRCASGSNDCTEMPTDAPLSPIPHGHYRELVRGVPEGPRRQGSPTRSWGADPPLRRGSSTCLRSSGAWTVATSRSPSRAFPRVTSWSP